MFVSAFSTEAPSSTSRWASRNSSDTGGAAFSVTAPSACETDCPAFMELATRSIARGRLLSNIRERAVSDPRIRCRAFVAVAGHDPVHDRPYAEGCGDCDHDDEQGRHVISAGAEMPTRINLLWTNAGR